MEKFYQKPKGIMVNISNQDEFKNNFLLVDADALILMALGCNHNIGFIQHKHTDPFDVKHTELGAPIEHFSWCANDDMVIQFRTTSD